MGDAEDFAVGESRGAHSRSSFGKFYLGPYCSLGLKMIWVFRCLAYRIAMASWLPCGGIGAYGPLGPRPALSASEVLTTTRSRERSPERKRVAF